MPSKIDMFGRKFGKLTAFYEHSKTKSGDIRWACKCDCGKIVFVVGANLRNGHTKSCGCIGKTKHGRSKSRLYEVWRGMKKRCYCKTSSGYEYYGGRGITVCEEWKNSFSSFEKWAFANGYDENAKQGDCTLDRINVNGNYEPSNCRWVDMKYQVNNRRKDNKNV